MNTSKILKTTMNNSKNNVIQNMPEYVFSENLKNILYGIPKELDNIKQVLKQKTDEVIGNAFIFENYVLIPAKEELRTELERVSLKLDILNSFSTLRLRDKIELNNNANLYIFSIGDAKQKLCKYNPKVATDRAKSEYYNEMRRIIETGKSDCNELLNEQFWFMDFDGRKIYNVAPNIIGHTPLSLRDSVEKELYNKLFNSK